MKVKIHGIASLTLILWVTGMYVTSAQSVIPVGSGSYAAQPPSYEYIGNDPAFGTFLDFATNSNNIDVAISKINEPIPTNDWWTSILTQEDGDGNRLGGNLWTYPLLSRFTTGGFEVGNIQGKWNTDILGSRSVSVDYLVALKGASFTPTKAIATNWSDWHVDLSAQVGDDSTKNMEVTLAQGMPFVWAKSNGFTPIVNAVHAGVRNYYNASGNELNFPATTDRFIIEYDGNLYGIHLSEAINITENTSGLTLNGYEGKWVVFSALNSITDLNTLHEYAFVRPTDTKLNYSYSPNEGKMTTTHVVTAEVITGSQTNVLQGFIPHHYRGNANTFSFVSAIEYVGTPRGTLKLAAGNNLSFEYEFNADILPHFNAPQLDESDAISYDDEIMKSMIDGYAGDVEFYGIGGGTYWGGKFLLRALKYALMAKETDNENYEFLLDKTKTLVHDWLTFTPGETENYYAYYPAWKGLIGFDEEYYSAYFTDNHFHYGYLVHAAALLEMAEPGAMDGYWDMLTKIIKTYANWDRNDGDFPYLRTFSPWMGHSMANGLGNAIGNNQESSSEAMQSWAGMFMTAEMTENTSMRDAAAFGYLMESRAIADYWYNESGTFEEIGYEKPVTGILEMNRYVYGTFFGAQETYIHGIQWLPISPAYGFWNDFLTTNEAAAIVDPIMNNMANDLENGISADWMNVSMGFKLFFDPEAVVAQFDGYWNAEVGSNEYQVAHNNGENGLTYYYGHASQNIGVRQSDYRLTLPLSSAFLKNGAMSYVVYNPSDTAQTCEVYQNNNLVTSFDVPANSLVTANNDGIINQGNTPNSNNLALDGTATQSTTTNNGGASRAIDGNTDGVWNNNSVTHTASGIGEWWQVDLEETYAVGAITISNRTNCCMFRLDDITVTVEDTNGTVLWSENITSSSATTLTVNAGGIPGSKIMITQNQNYPLSLAEVEVYEYEGSTTDVFPDPTKTYYIDSPVHNLRIGATGESEAPFTTATSTIGDDVGWKFIAKGNGYWHIQRAAGGTLPRLRTDNSEFADMQGTAWSGTYTYYELTEGYTAGSYFLTLPDAPDAYKRVQVNNLGEVKMVSTASNRTWESFTFTEVTSTTPNSSLFIEAEEYATMNGVLKGTTDDTTVGGEYVGWIDTGDWIEYSVDVPSAGSYTIDFRLASAPGSKGFEFQVNGSTLTSLGVNSTGGWDTWYTASANVFLSAGTQTIRLYAVAGSWNINWLEIATATAAKIILKQVLEGVQFYPNPVSDILTLSIGDNSTISKIELIDVTGKKQLTKIVSEKTTYINLKNIARGVYFIRLLDGNNLLEVRKLLKH